MIRTGRSRARRSPRTRWRPLACFVLAFLIGMLGLNAVTPAASAAPVYEIKGDWEANTPGTVAKGDVVTAIFRVNVNDDQAAPANDPVDNVTLTVTATHGRFSALPDACLTTAGLDPVSGISTDGRTLTCNLGTHDEGTAHVIQVPVIGTGETGDELSLTGSIADLTAPLEPIEFDNPFGMDIAWGSSTNTVNYNAASVDTDLEWSLFLNAGSSPDPTRSRTT